MNQSSRINYGQSDETVSQAFMHSCLGKSLILGAILAVILVIAYFTAPTDKEMRAEMNDAIMQCMEMNDSIRGDQIDDYVNNIGFIFTTADTTKVAQEWREAFDKYNRLDVGIGAFGVCVPTVNFNDFLLRTGPVHKGYNQKLIRNGVIPDTDLGSNPNIQEFHYKRNPDD